MGLPGRSLLTLCLIVLASVVHSLKTSEKEAEVFLKNFEVRSDASFIAEVEAEWNYDSDLTKANEERLLQVSAQTASFDLVRQSHIVQFNWTGFKNVSLKRQFRLQSLKGMAALTKPKLKKLQMIKSNMSATYGKGKISSQSGKQHNLHLDPDLTKIMAESRDYDELEYVWKAWRDAVGKPIRSNYIEYAGLSNEASRLNGFADYTNYLLKDYESKTFLKDIEKLWETVKPLYEDLHFYVKRKLINKYGDKKIKETGTIPAHLLGNMWAQSWSNIFNLVTPFPDKSVIDVTDALKKQGYNPKKMFKTAEKFFTSLGLKEMTQEFWNRSIITKPPNREMVCHGSAWDFGTKKDFRIKMCTVVTMEDFVTIHHEMGHVQYFMQYANQPLVFREGANPGFHEAIGDTLALSVMTPEHLHRIGLLKKVTTDKETDLNFLMSMALDKVAFLPFGYLIDKWRWELFSGKTKNGNMNKRWWELREIYQGVSPPVDRSEDDFDPGSKYHIPAGVPYVRYFVSFIIQFQFHEALCNISGHNGSLHRCDISGYTQKTEAGKALASMLKLGRSKPWPDAMFMLTKQRKMKADSLLKYFEPLHKWLKEQNKGHNVKWTVPKPEDAMRPDPIPNSKSSALLSSLFLIVTASMFAAVYHI